MASTKLLGKTIVVSLALVCVLTVAMMPVASASYGDTRRFLRPSPFGVGQAKLFDVYMDAAWNPPGRIVSLFTVGIPWGQNWLNVLDSNEALMIAPVGIFVEPPEYTDAKSAREFYATFRYVVTIDGEELPTEMTPLRPCTFVDRETGEKYRWWEWRCGATFKAGEFEEYLGGLGTYTIRFRWYSGETLLFDSDDFGVFQFQLV